MTGVLAVRCACACACGPGSSTGSSERATDQWAPKATRAGETTPGTGPRMDLVEPSPLAA